ncbi:MAG: hypothetical protein IJV69_06795 [Kiritimatiellae bacterium]|nr:hypothetical protein [Kiritimatiellia bacterium]
MRKMEDWEWEAWIEKYEGFERFIGRATFWFVIVAVIGALIINIVMLTSIIRTYCQERANVAQQEANYGQD